MVPQCLNSTRLVPFYFFKFYNIYLTGLLLSSFLLWLFIIATVIKFQSFVGFDRLYYQYLGWFLFDLVTKMIQFTKFYIFKKLKYILHSYKVSFLKLDNKVFFIFRFNCRPTLSILMFRYSFNVLIASKTKIRRRIEGFEPTTSRITT